jgi:hypothetical protein
MLTHLVISEIRSRGVGGAADELVELWNPTATPVTLDNTWSLDARSNMVSSYSTHWIGTGMTIPAHGHFLIAGTAYTQTPASDQVLSSGLTDAMSVRLMHNGVVVDAVCYAFDSSAVATFTGDATYTCEGTPVGNNPHDNSSSTSIDASIERLPGGSGGNCTDTGNNAADFGVRMPATPMSSQSAPTP